MFCDDHPIFSGHSVISTKTEIVTHNGEVGSRDTLLGEMTEGLGQFVLEKY